MVEARLADLHPLLVLAAGIERLTNAPGTTVPEAHEASLRAILARFDNQNLMVSVARLLAKVGQKDLAKQAIEAFAPSPPSASAALQLASIESEGPEAFGTILEHGLNALHKDPTNFALYVRLAKVFFDAGDKDSGVALLDLIDDIRLPDAATNAACATLLWRNGRAAQSIPRLEASYALGNRDPSFLIDFMDLLTGEMLYDRIEALPDFGTPGTRLYSYSRMLKGHAALARRFTQAGLIETAVEREQGSDWLTISDLMGRVARAMNDRVPFSAVRFGDGEARFLICSDPSSKDVLSASQLKAIGDVIWQNWFGADFAEPGVAAMANMRDKIIDAVQSADAVGITENGRFKYDTGHLGYLATAERLITGLPGLGVRKYFDAMGHFKFDKVEPSLSSLLRGLDFVGIIGPHANLGEAVKRRFEIGRIDAYVVPGELRLKSLDGHTRPHYPVVFEETLERLSVPHPGALFLVGAGLLGKIYCAEIKRRGGIALDVGSVVDGWMGLETRPGLSAAIPAL